MQGEQRTSCMPHVIVIEDDVLVTEDGCEVLTSRAPKEPEEVEALVGSDPAP